MPHFNDSLTCKQVAHHIISISLRPDQMTKDVEDFTKAFFYVKEVESCFSYDPRD